MVVLNTRELMSFGRIWFGAISVSKRMIAFDVKNTTIHVFDRIWIAKFDLYNHNSF